MYDVCENVDPSWVEDKIRHSLLGLCVGKIYILLTYQLRKVPMLYQ